MVQAFDPTGDTLDSEPTVVVLEYLGCHRGEVRVVVHMKNVNIIRHTVYTYISYIRSFPNAGSPSGTRGNSHHLSIE